MQNQEQILARNSQKGQPEGKPHNYKTIYCKFYAQGQCKLGHKCTYAHQRKEKRKKKLSQEYKYDNNPVQTQWTQAQWKEYYQQQWYYYQMCQMQQQPYQYAQNLYQPQLSPEEGSLEKMAEGNQRDQNQPSDVPQEIKREIAGQLLEQEKMKKEEGEVETPEVKKIHESPGSGETEANTVGTLTRLDSLGHSSQFKSEE